MEALIKKNEMRDISVVLKNRFLDLGSTFCYCCCSKHYKWPEKRRHRNPRLGAL